MDVHHSSLARGGGWWGALALGATFLALYALTVPGNHSEADDAFAYAWDVEHLSAGALWHGQHLLYGPLMRGMYVAARSAGLADRAYGPMLACSLVCGGLAAGFLYLLLRRRLRFSGREAAAVTVLAGGSYGIWRYACEVEIYLPAVALVLLALHAAASPRGGWRAAVAALAGAAAVLVHAAAAAPALVSIPAMHLVERRWRRAAAHVLAAGAIVLCAYGASHKAPWGDGARRLAGSPPVALAKGAVGLGQTVVSGNFLFGLSWVRDELPRLYPERQLAEEVYMGRRAAGVPTWLGGVTLAALALAVLIAFAAAARHGRPGASDEWATARRRRGVLVASATWLALHAVLVLYYEPANPEMWVMAVPALWLALALASLPRLADDRGRAALPVLAGCLLVHNAVGGFWPIAAAASDYNVAKSRWLATHAGAGDVILTADTSVFADYLRYTARARVLSLYDDREGGPADWSAVAAGATGRVYATADVFDPPAVMRARAPSATARVQAFGAAERPRFALTAADEFGGVYERTSGSGKRHGADGTSAP